MAIKNQEGEDVAKRKQQANSKKDLQRQINEIGQATSMVIGEIRNINNHLIGLEHLNMSLAEFLGKKEEFEEFVTKRIKQMEEDKKAEDKVKEMVTKKQG